ncbi:MAG: leucine-rich repeat domain-containing protein [Candidatus Poribacteria bacterium]|nr:leucine-rich repeat domain-containing protein [Candidatus Poribacteria bacterium]
MYKRLLSLIVVLFMFITMNIAYTQEEHWMPDATLRKAVRERLIQQGIGIPENTPLTPASITRMGGLDIRSMNITSLKGLEHAVNLQTLVAIGNQIQDLRPLANLKEIHFLDLSGNQISDLSPLAGLVNLEVLRLGGNQITDVSPLAGLVNLKEIILSYNQIADISSLAGLANLENLRIKNNEKRVLWTLPVEKLKQFGYDEVCDLEGVSTSERIEDREYPSVFSAWSNIINLPNLSWRERLAYHDLHWSSLLFDMEWLPTPEGLRTFLHVETAKNERDDLLSLNPNMIFIVSMNYQAANPGEYPEDWPYWVRDESGNRIEEEHGPILIDFTYPEVQDYLVRQVVEFAKCGLFDGIFLDWWREEWRDSSEAQYYAHDVSEAAITLLRRMRESVDEVRDDFLIIVNTNRSKVPRSAPYVNGTFMETIEPYSYKDLKEIESTLLWSEQNFQEPQINCLEGWADKREPPDGPRNQQWMRLFTTMSLTLSDGYVNFVRGFLPDHMHLYEILYEIREDHSEVHARGELHSHPGNYWFPFYDTPLGRPVGGDETKGQLYENREGLFIREFTNGWAVYNRSGKAQQIELPEKVSGVASGVKDKRSHTLPDLDGEIYLKTPVQIAPGKYPPLYWVDAKTGTLHRLANNKVENPVPRVQNAISLVVDAAAGKLYWTEKTGNRTGKIQGANLDGTNLQLVKDLTSAPLDIAIDTTAGKIYLSNTWGKIQRMNLDGSNFQPNLITGLKTPQNLVLDTAGGQLYWTEQTSKTTGKIQRANLDGSNVQLVKALTSAPRGMALDAVNRKLYMTNAWGKLQRMNLDGSNFQPNFITGLESPGQVIVDVTGGKVYWTEQGKLRRADLDGGNIQDVVIGLGELADLTLGIDSAGQTGIAAAPMTQTVVEQTSLLANYPNPFNPETWIPYHLANPSDVQITIYDARGSIVRRLDLGHQREGYYTSRSRAAYWDGRNDVGERVASGIYFYQLQAENVSFLRKMVILK